MLKTCRVVSKTLGWLSLVAVAWTWPAVTQATKPDIVIGDFEGSNWGDWTVTGEAFGSGPTQGRDDFWPYHGERIAYSMVKGDAAVGTLTSPEFRIQRRYITFLIGGGNHPGETCINLLLGGKVVRTATGADHEWLRRSLWDVAEFQGRPARIELVDRHRGNWGHISVDHVVQTDERRISPWMIYEDNDAACTRIPLYTREKANGWKTVGTLFGPEAGRAVSPEFRIDHRYLHFVFPPANLMTAVCLRVGGRPVCASGSTYGPTSSDGWRSWDVGAYQGRAARFEVIDRYMVNLPEVRRIAVFLSDDKLPCSLLVEQFKDSAKIAGALPDVAFHYRPGSDVKYKEDLSSRYNEKLRPQFHFTVNHGPLNDPNGLVYYDGEYHMFMQHEGWGHAVSKDLVHWTQLEHALSMDNLGWPASGSAVVDWNNASGFQTGREKPLVAVFASWHMYNFVNPTECYFCQVQSLAYSNDRGRTWTKYAGNPVIHEQDRDPKMFWHEPTKSWRLVMMQEPPGRAYFASSDLKHWKKVGAGAPGGECPDMFELPVLGDPAAKRWIAVTGDGAYFIGGFDGSNFTPESDRLVVDYGPNFYATQTFNDIPKRDGRTIQITWMKNWAGPEHVEYSGIPFNGQQMTFPRELTLRRCREGLRMFSNPVREIEKLHQRRHVWNDLPLVPGQNPLADLTGELFDVRMEIDLGDAAEVGLRARGEPVSYLVKEKKLTCRIASAPVEAIGNRLKLQILVDRISLEAFAQHGKANLNAMFMPKEGSKPLELFARGGVAKVVSLEVYELRSIW